MRVRCVSMVVIMLVGLATAVPVQAQSLCDSFRAFADSVVRDFKRNNCWPEPFVRPDRQAVRAPFGVMVHNGWRRQNMLGDHHFKEQSAALNEAGEIKVRWIMTQAPPHHRTIYVHRGNTADETSARVEAVQQVAMGFAEGDQLPAVAVTNIDATGWPATNVDMIQRAWVQSSPEPRLPTPQQTGLQSE